MKQHKLKKRIAYLSSKESTGKTFVSIYLAFNGNVDFAIDAIKTALRKNEEKDSALDTVLKQLLQYVRQISAVAENGAAIFAGVFPAEGSESPSFHVEEIMPPEPVGQNRFEVGNLFEFQPLREMLRDPKVVGVLLLDAKNATLGLVSGERVEIIRRLSSGVPGKTGKGGQSQRRYERERDMELTAFFHRVADYAATEFLDKHPITVLFVGGPGQTKNDFVKGKYLNYTLDNVLLQTYSTQSTDETAVKDVVYKAKDLLGSMCGPEEKQVVERLQSELRKPLGGLATYGLDPVLGALKKGEVEVILVTDDSGYEEVVAVCRKCGNKNQRLIRAKKPGVNLEMASELCPKCGGTDFELTRRDIVDVLEDLAAQTDARVEVISSESPQKTQLNALGGVAALLRFRR